MSPETDQHPAGLQAGNWGRGVDREVPLQALV